MMNNIFILLLVVFVVVSVSGVAGCESDQEKEAIAGKDSVKNIETYLPSGAKLLWYDGNGWSIFRMGDQMFLHHRIWVNKGWREGVGFECLSEWKGALPETGTKK